MISMAIQHRLAVIIRDSTNDDQFLLNKQTRPPKFDDEDYDHYVDSDLYDLPWCSLNPSQDESASQITVRGSESCADKLDLGKFDVESGLNHGLYQLGLRREIEGQWELWKFVEEAEFGPGEPIQTVFIHGRLRPGDEDPQVFRWMSVQSCLDLILEVKPSGDRIGPLVSIGLLNDLRKSVKCSVPSTLRYQEYPVGVMLVPMRSRTIKPFHTTNLVVIAPDKISGDSGDSRFAACADALIVDPGCHSGCHSELEEVIAALPRKLVVFVTHHHRDHVDGLSVIQKCNPDAILIAHESTLRRIGKDDWSLGHIAVSGEEEICIGGERLNVIFAPGHTDGHMALLHVYTHSLILGDHCVGQGSAVLDINSGGNLKDYFQTTYKFMELAPHALIPMHGRVNLWPKHMLCGYLKNRRQRESSILKAIENGAETLFDIVAKAYYDVDPSFWIAASSNVRLHVDHLAQQDKLPKEWSVQKFKTTCRLRFLNKWLGVYLKSALLHKTQKLSLVELLTVPVAGFAVLYAIKQLMAK
ncbi:hypothetical protein Sjap_024536 [Stephania japonica]|uniref:Metallo-beta-lactamase domain-containing protein n=1 Tax=Stephania japonica TaxID=461633 RepID=A0AAP0EM77_9MAGN